MVDIMKLKQSKEIVSTLLLPKHWRWARPGQLGFPGSAGSPEMGAGKYWSLWWRSADGHSGWRICWRNQCIHTGKEEISMSSQPAKHSFKLKYTQVFEYFISEFYMHAVSFWTDSFSTSKRTVSEGNLSKWSSNTWNLHYKSSFVSSAGAEIWMRGIWSSSQWLLHQQINMSAL